MDDKAWCSFCSTEKQLATWNETHLQHSGSRRHHHRLVVDEHFNLLRGRGLGTGRPRPEASPTPWWPMLQQAAHSLSQHPHCATTLIALKEIIYHKLLEKLSTFADLRCSTNITCNKTVLLILKVMCCSSQLQCLTSYLSWILVIFLINFILLS